MNPETLMNAFAVPALIYSDIVLGLGSRYIKVSIAGFSQFALSEA